MIYVNGNKLNRQEQSVCYMWNFSYVTDRPLVLQIKTLRCKKRYKQNTSRCDLLSGTTFDVAQKHVIKKFHVSEMCLAYTLIFLVLGYLQRSTIPALQYFLL